MVPFKRLPLKSDGTEGHEYHQRNHLLDHFQLNQVERSPVIPETDAIRRYLKQYSKKAINPEARYSLWGSMTNIQEDYLPRKIR